MQEFFINWLEPKKVNYQFDREENDYRFESIDIEDGMSGVYQIIADHPLYGHRKTVYIGKAKDILKRNDFRFDEKRVDLKFWRLSEPIFIGVGLIYDVDHKPITDDQTISIIESLLIARHMPALNSKGIDELSEKAYEILILNDGYTNGLLPDCSGIWFRTSA